MTLTKRRTVALVCIATVVVGFWVAWTTYIPAAPDLSQGATRVLFTGHMYALTNSARGRNLKASMMEEKASLLVFGGDSVSGASARHLEGKTFDQNLLRHQWKLFDEFTDEIPGEVVVLPGNHDLLTVQGDPIHSEMVANLAARSPFPALYGKRVIGGCSLYFMNTFDETPARPAFQLDSEQLDWLLTNLDSDLSRGTSCVLLFMHHRLWEIENYTSPLKGDPGQFPQIESRLKDFSTAIVCAGDLGTIESFRKSGIEYFNVSNMVGHSGYVRFDFDQESVRYYLREHGSRLRFRIYDRLRRLH